jgi:hypothetical protein
MNGLLGGVNPSLGRLCFHVDHLHPFPLPYHMTGVGEPHEITVKWTCDQLDWFSLIIIIFINANSPFFRTPQERVSWFLFRLSLCLFSSWVSWLFRVFFKSHSSALWECSPWVLPPFTWTSLQPGYHENCRIYGDSSLIAHWANFEHLSFR